MIALLGALAAYVLWRAWRNRPARAQIVFGQQCDTDLYRSDAWRLVYRCPCGTTSIVQDPVTHVCSGCSRPATTRAGDMLASPGSFAGRKDER